MRRWGRLLLLHYCFAMWIAIYYVCFSFSCLVVCFWERKVYFHLIFTVNDHKNLFHLLGIVMLFHTLFFRIVFRFSFVFTRKLYILQRVTISTWLMKSLSPRPEKSWEPLQTQGHGNWGIKPRCYLSSVGSQIAQEITHHCQRLWNIRKHHYIISKYSVSYFVRVLLM